MSVAYTAPGVYIRELPRDSRTIVGVSTSRTAFVGAALRGPVEVPTLVTSFADFERRFGGLWAASALGFAVQQFFQNGGGEALIVRVVNRAPDVPDPPAPDPPTPDPGAKSSRAGLPKQGGGTVVTLAAASPGVWGDRLRARVSVEELTATEISAGLFHLELLELDAAGNTAAQERFVRVTSTPGAARALDRLLESESALARVDGTMAAGVPVPHSGTTTTAFVGGSDGDAPRVTEDVIGSPSARTGMHALLAADLFNLLCIPLATWATSNTDVIAMWNAGIALCNERRAVLIVDPPSDWNTPAKAATGMATASWARGSNAAAYFPRVIATDALQEGRLRDFPPCGVVAGTIARIDAERGVWKSPAGIEANLLGVPDITVPMTDIEQGELNKLGLNVLRRFPVTGVVVWGARTREGADVLASQWKYLAVRRLALYLEESLFRGNQWAVFEPNDEPLWSQLRLSITSFMHGLFRQGAFAGTSARQAYFVRCDHDTTTQADIDRGVVNIIIGFAPLQPAEFVVIKLQQLAAESA
ncbi:MAG TPA: phage tail sheath subtilisin-like domain-containing protein [Nannocystaceae bacterium]|nr:phage tail sheath subtilisin-like domain-containing protein [Nannocystaceae bacterium]